MIDFKSTLRSIEKKYGTGVANIGIDKTDRPKFSLGSPGLDYMTYMQIPQGIFVEVTGSEGAGKTLISYLMAADYIKKEKEKPEEERRGILYVDAEGTADESWAYVSAHYDMNDPDIPTAYVTPLGQSAEQIFDIVREFVTTGSVGLVIFDSLTAIAPQQTNEESFEKKDMGGIAKPLADFVKRCTGVFNRYRTTFIGINGTTQNISGYGNPETSPGGTYWRRACSLRLKVKRGDFFDDDWNELKSTAENPSGHVVEVALLKSKFCRADRKLGRCHLNYRKGVDLLWDTIEVATNFGLIDNSTQGSFKIIDPETGEIMLDDEGNEVKIRGKKNLKPYFEEHPLLWKKLYDKVYEMLSITDDPSIKSFEELLNINMSERFNESFDGE